jgi:predicted aldo/keto reductase-like oxidoreductase
MISNTSNIIAGTMNWGAWGSKLSTFAMQERIETYLSENIITFDHADIYGGYTTETDFGKAWKNMSIARENVRFVTKCGIKMIAENREYGSKHYDYSKKHIIWRVENTLKNIQTEDFERINFLKKKFKVRVAFGNHYHGIRGIITSLSHNVDAVLFYVKGEKKIIYPDHNHAIYFSRINKLVDKINRFKKKK